MSKRAPALSTQLKEANNKLAELQKKLDEANRMKEYYQKLNSDGKTEIEEMHSFFDQLPGAAPRKFKISDYADGEARMMTRLATYFACKSA